ncbi:MAG: PHP domain-containing protein [Omnitrophica bacterium]|nr:PHP domain-containing protein [Candidatus Omnitrophota bacterium]
MKYADLHVHTNFSDGTFTPEEVVREANGRGFSSIAICDHDCVDGIGLAIEAAKGSELEIIPGVELTVIKNGQEIHVLGYFISWEEEWFRNILKVVQKERHTRIDRMLVKLKQFNIILDRESVISIAGGGVGSIGRLHLARAMAKLGVVSCVQEAFDKYIGDFRPCYVEDIGFGPKEAIDLILKAKGVPVLAHPSAIKNDSLVREFIKDGVRGIEIFHSNHKSADRKKYRAIAEESGILITGGSDCHGLAKYRVLMGSVKVPYDIVERLKEEASAMRESGSGKQL